MKSPEKCTIAELEPYAREWLSRTRKGNTSRQRVELPCAECGAPLSARERRQPCKFCGARNPRIISPA